ncbi:MAG: YdeI/OmpD-associated family protein [Pseudomonadota bacterium]
MSDYHAFEACVEPMDWGKSTYTVLRLPPEVEEALVAEGAKRVEGEVNDHPVNLALTRAPVIDGAFLWAGKTLLDAAGIAPGEWIEVRLRKADPDAVEVPGDVTAALYAAGAVAAFEALSPGKKRGVLHRIETAKRAETRMKRIAEMIAGLGDAA